MAMTLRPSQHRRKSRLRFLCDSATEMPSQPKLLQKILCKRMVLAQCTMNLLKLENNHCPKQIASYVLLQTGTNEWQQHYKENVARNDFVVVFGQDGRVGRGSELLCTEQQVPSY